MRLSTLDLGVFLAAEVIGEQAALSLHHEIQPLRAVLVEQDGPVGVVRPQRCRHLEPARQLGVEHHTIVHLQRLGKLPFGVRVVDDVLVNRPLRVQQHIAQVAR